MSKFECPRCTGGFPEPVKWQKEWVCPWCYEELLEHHSTPTSTIGVLLGEYGE